MLSAPFNTAYRLSLLVAFAATIASAGGLFLPDLYQDNALVTAAFRGNDFVTLFVAVPLLAWGLFYARRGSKRAQVIWFGALAYMLYNYVFYLYGAAFNLFFLLYMALVTLSIYALIAGLIRIDAEDIKLQFSLRTPVRWASGYALFIAVLLAALWIGQTVHFIISGEIPVPITQTSHPTGVVFATDLTLLVPAMALGAVWLWQRRPWGYVLCTMLMVKGTTYTLAMILMSVFADRAGIPGAWALAPLWAVLGVGCLITTGLLLGNMQVRDNFRSGESRN